MNFNEILTDFKNNVPEIVAILISSLSLFISYKRYRIQLTTLTKNFRFDLEKTFIYEAVITLKNTNEQIEIIGYKLFKKKGLRYNAEKFVCNLKNPIIGSQTIDLFHLNDVGEGNYKLIFYLNRHPRKLSIKFKHPFDGKI